MKFTAAATFFLGAVAQLVAAAPLVARDVYVPKITSPVGTTVWKAGETVKVTWYVSYSTEHGMSFSLGNAQGRLEPSRSDQQRCIDRPERVGPALLG